MSIPHIHDISEEQINNLQKDSFIVIDVRTIDEYEDGHIESATHIPVENISKTLDKIPQDKKILLYCRSGTRSQNATEYLKNNHYQAFNLGSFFQLSDNIIKKLNG